TWLKIHFHPELPIKTGVAEGIQAVIGETEKAVFNKYCTHDAGLEDFDQDGFPDCLDPCPEDETNGCEQCDQNYQDLISQCKSESNILYWDNVNCTGRCSQQSNLGDCPGQ
ncbi:MAG: hypothetical protein M8353_11800, partial [ANME-2 cluster archaeon]|nr:hypothetical protein [ANME-2 cluster archaeon]